MTIRPAQRKGSEMKIEVDLDSCRGYALCVGMAPEYYEINEDGVAHCLKADVEPGDEDRIRDTAAICPQLAISLTEA